MRITFLLSIFYFSFLSIFYSQDCTPDDIESTCYVDYVYSGTGDEFNVKVYLHKINDGNGENGVSDELIYSSFQDLRDCFSGSGINFVSDCEIYGISNQGLYENYNYPVLFDSNYENDDGLDIYFSPAASGGSTSAAAHIGGDPQVSMRYADISGGVAICHEVGHAFGLFHTFHSCGDDDEGIDNGLEPVSRTALASDGTTLLCEILGDRVCDTPASREHLELCVSISSCEITERHFGDECVPLDTDNDGNPILPLDASGDTITPATNNYMSRVGLVSDGSSCRTEFTDGQIERMKAFLENCPALINIIGNEGLCQDCLNPDPCDCSDVAELVWQNVVYDDQEFIVLHDEIVEVFGNVEIKNGSIFHMRQGSEIRINDGATLTIDNSELSSCFDEYWKGITIMDGGNLVLNEAILSDGLNGITALDGSYLDFVESTINAISIGLFIDGDIELNSMLGSVINGSGSGLYFTNGSEMLFLRELQIIDCPFGVILNGAQASLQHFTINESNIGVLLNQSSGTIINDNSIDFSQTGILGSNCIALNISENLIGGNTFGENGIKLISVTESSIVNNPIINATSSGISTINSNTYISRNIINIEGDGSSSSGGIQLTTSGFSTLFQNFIIATGATYGIESVGSNGSNINDNDVLFTGGQPLTGGIRLMGSINETVRANDVQSLNGSGFIAQNSTGNTIDCNDFFSDGNAMGILENSEGQGITANELFGTNSDMTLNSEVGLQIHNGNEFQGGFADAEALSLSQLANSIFFINDEFDSHEPSDGIPDLSVWFIIEDEEATGCGGAPNPLWIPFFNEPFLCKYWENLKKLEEVNKSKFTIKVLHLIKISQLRDGFNLPQCVTKDSLFTKMCGFKEIAEVEKELSEILKINDEQLDASILSLKDSQTRFINSENKDQRLSVERELEREIVLLNPLIDNEIQNDSIVLDSVSQNLLNSYCDFLFLNFYKDNTLRYINFLQSRRVREEEESDWLLASKKCSDIYGDIVHVSRVVAKEFTSEYFDVHDGCYESAEPRTTNSTQSINDLLIFPNPSKGEFILDFQQNINGQIDIYNLKGESHFSRNVEDINQITCSLVLPPGLYFIKFTSIEGEIILKKLTITF